MLSLVCAFCKQSFERFPSQATKYCSPSCSYADRRGKPKVQSVLQIQANNEKKGKTHAQYYGVEVAAARLDKVRVVATAISLAFQATRRKPNNRGQYEELVWREQIKQRDNYTCQDCGKAQLVGRDCHAHHIKPWDEYPELRYNLENGRTLCCSCHMIATQEETRLRKLGVFANV